MEKNGLTQTYYLLLHGYPWVHDGDEFLGVYVDTEKLKQAYLAESDKLEKLKATNHYRSDMILIYRFCESDYGKADVGQIVQPDELW